MTELAWLIEMLVHQKMSTSMKDKFISRIGAVESAMVANPQPIHTRPITQAPSTQRMLDSHQEQIMQMEGVITSPIAAQALQARQQAIAQATSGAPEKGRTSPRKF